MGALSDFIAREFQQGRRQSETETRGAAIVAINAILEPENSNSSDNSRVSNLKSAQWCACGASASFGVGWFLRQPEKARWYCGPCFRRLPASGKA